jgi:energy-coupling factor transporter ATP-binding protein EcfA2
MTDAIRFSTTALDELARAITDLMAGNDPALILGADLSQLTARIPSPDQATPSALVRLALLNDALCVAERALKKDGVTTPAEIAYIEPLAREAHKYLARVRNVYRDTVDPEGAGLVHFVEQHAVDTQKFGGSCRSTTWLGLSICQRATDLSGNPHYVNVYRDLVSRSVDELFGAVGAGTTEQKAELTAELVGLLPPAKATRDPREAAYCSPSAAEVFHAVAHSAEVFEIDPFDVDTIHADARLAFSRLLDRVGSQRFGRILLVKGEAGSGKTHLMRAFRNLVHGEQAGFVGYFQMSTSVTNYARYILQNLIDSWDRPYWGEIIPDAAITCLSDAVANILPDGNMNRLRDEALGDVEIHDLVNRAADQFLGLPGYARVHVDLVRMMLYLQRREPARRTRVLKFLRCETMNAHDRSFIGDVAPFEGDEGPARMLAELGRLVTATRNGALVLLVDQLEDVYNQEDSAKRFRLAMDALRHVTDHVPTSVVVIACLEDFYIQLRGALAKPMLERIEHDPDPIKLTAGRSLPEIEDLVRVRLAHLFERQGVPVRSDDALFPFTHQELATQANHRTRDVLEWCRLHHDASIAEGRIRAPKGRDTVVPPPPPNVTNIAQLWNDHKTTAGAAPEDEEGMAELLGWSLTAMNREQPHLKLSVSTHSSYLALDSASGKIVIGLCDKTARGGYLGGQIEALTARASQQGAIPVAVRSSEYPPPGATKVAQLLKGLLQVGGRRVVITDSEWRHFHAFRTFCDAQSSTDGLELWIKAERPLSGLTSIRSILDWDAVPTRSQQPSPTAAADKRPPAPSPAQPKADVTPPPARRPPPNEGSAFAIGQTRGLTPQPVLAQPTAFVTHAAFLGSSGSGKTTLALAILEKLLLQGTPVLMLDRKGDLCSYARHEFWTSPASDSQALIRQALRERTDIHVYTPGEPRGRALTLPVVPSGLGELAAHERGIVARYAAAALGTMMGYRKSKTDDTRLGILGKAIELVGRVSGTDTPGIGSLVTVLDDEDPELVSLVGRLDPKHFRALVENLETLRLRYEHLLRDDAEPLSPAHLFGFDGDSGRARLSIISTKFLGDSAAVDFWVARLLGELSRWASRSPASNLQAVVFLDEADIYLPATSKPATKEPLLDLLKRARSAGLGVFLATQSPGDLDYRCRDNIRTWFVGRVAEKTAVEKMKPLLSESRTNVSGKLANAKVGEFFKLQDGDAIEFKAEPSLMRTTQVPEDQIIGLARQTAS